MPLDIIGRVISGARGIIDELHTSDEERAAAAAKLDELQHAERMAGLEMERGRLEAEVEVARLRASVMEADAAGESGLQRSWRPIACLALTAMVVMHFMGWSDSELQPSEVEWLMRIVAISVGGVTLGKSVERIANQKWGDGMLGRRKAAK